MHRAQLCGPCHRARFRSEPRAAVLFPEAHRCHPERCGRRRRRSSVSIADQELPSRGRTGRGAEIRRHQYSRREGPRSCLWLCAGPRHDAARSAERHGGGEEAVGNRQELRPCGGAGADPSRQQDRPFHQGRNLARGQRHGAAELRSRQDDLERRRTDREALGGVRAQGRRYHLFGHAGKRRARGEGRRAVVQARRPAGHVDPDYMRRAVGGAGSPSRLVRELRL